MADQIDELLAGLYSMSDRDNPEVLPLLASREKAPEYPILALPETLQKAAKAIAEHVQAPLPLAAQVVIGAAVTLAQTRANAPHLHNTEGMPCSMFMLTLANSGDRKSECRRLAFKVIDELEQENRKRYQEQRRKIGEQTASMNSKQKNEFLSENPLPPDPRTQYSDTTFEPLVMDFIRGMADACWDTDEGAQLFGGSSMKAEHSASVLGGLTKAFDQGRFERNRSASNAEGSGYANHRRLSILLLAQEITIAKELNDPILRGQGFLPRFLFTSTESLAGTRFLSKERLQQKSYTDPRLQAFWKRCRKIQELPEFIDPETNEVRPPVMIMPQDAEEAWLEFYNEIEAEQVTLGEFFQVQAFASRAGELARRLATVFAVFEQSDHINYELMRCACEVIRHSVHEWRRFADKAQPSEALVEAYALFQWLIDPCRTHSWKKFHKNKLSKQSRVRSSAKKRDKCLDLLVQHNYLLTEDKKNYRINPRALSAESAEIAESPIDSGFDHAEALRTSAENDLNINFSAPFRISSAQQNPDSSQPCAVSAVSAGATQAKAIDDDAEFF